MCSECAIKNYILYCTLYEDELCTDEHELCPLDINN